jgi:hypothetical protein
MAARVVKPKLSRSVNLDEYRRVKQFSQESCAERTICTHKNRRRTDFKSVASADSATSAFPSLWLAQ